SPAVLLPPWSPLFPYTTLFRSRDELSSSELLRRSDMAMYVSKEGGKNRCTWFSDDFDKNRDIAQQVECDLREALRLQEFRLAYQDRKSTRLNSSHVKISYAVFC